jgi:hypothetical protein
LSSDINAVTGKAVFAKRISIVSMLSGVAGNGIHGSVSFFFISVWSSRSKVG